MQNAVSTRLQNSWGTILFCLLVGLLLILPRLAVPAFAQVFIDEILVQDRQDWLRPLLLGMGITTILRAFLARLRLTYLRRLMVKLSVSTSGQFLWHILRLPIGFYDQRFAGEISNRMQLNDRVAEVLSGSLATTLIDVVMMVFYLLIMIQYDQLLSAIAVSFAAINIFALLFLSQTRVDANMRLAQEYGKVGGVTVSGIQTIETVKASGLESDLFARFAGYYAKALNAQQELGLQTQILTTLPTILTAFAKLICGLYQPWFGEICFDGVARSQIKRSVLANSLAMVEQDIFLFAGTVRENITLWDSTVPEADLIQACQDAAIHDACDRFSACQI
jgi:ABC-type bacteriocin/lantibiotic exporter with double-glycine peptidase domain